MMLAELQVRLWFEYVETRANWSDGASRELYKHEWTRQNFTMKEVTLQEWPWQDLGEERKEMGVVYE